MLSTRSPVWYRLRGQIFLLLLAAGFLLTSSSRENGPLQALYLKHSWLIAIGFIAAVGALLIRVWGTMYLSTDVVQASDTRTERLVIDGPFRYLRNPLYAGNILFAVALSMLVSVVGAFIIVVGVVAVSAILAREESRAMEARYGTAYREYAYVVPAFVPRLIPYESASSVRTECRRALANESFGISLCSAYLPVAGLAQPGFISFLSFWLFWKLFDGVARIWRKFEV